MLEKAAEQDEQEDVRGRHQRRDAVDALAAEVERANDLVEPVAAVRDGAGQVLAEEAVGEERGADDRQGDSQHPARPLEQQDDHQRPHHQVGGAGIAGTLDQVGFEHPMVERQRERERGKQRVIPDDPVAVRLRGNRVDQVDEQQQKADVQRAGDEA